MRLLNTSLIAFMCVIFLVLSWNDMLHANNGSLAIQEVNGKPTLVCRGSPFFDFSYFNASGDLKVMTNTFAHEWRDRIGHSWQFNANPWVFDLTNSDGKCPFIQKMIDFIRFDPSAMIMLRLSITLPKEWAATHPKEMHAVSNGSKNVAGISFASETWRLETVRAMRLFLDMIKSTVLADGSSLYDHISGCILFVGETGEWNNYREPGPHRMVDATQGMTIRFREFLKRRYGTIAALNAHWNSAFSDFNDIMAPSERSIIDSSMDGAFVAVDKHRNIIDYYRAYSHVKAEALIHFSQEYKKMFPDKLCGAFWNSMTFDSIGGARHQNAEGRRQNDIILNCPFLDFICTPHAYNSMRPGMPEELQFPVDSIAANGKTGYFEFDQHLHNRAMTQRWNIGNPLHKNEIVSESQSIAVIQRAFGYALAKGLNIWWWDQEGCYPDTPNGVAFDNSAIKNVLAECRRIGNEALTKPRMSVSEVAIIIQDDCYLLSSVWGGVTRSSLYSQIEEISFGAPYDIFLVNDLKKMKKSYKLYIFLNLYTSNEDLLRHINARKRDNTVMVWVYAPGLFNEQCPSITRSLAHMRSLTGFSCIQSPRMTCPPKVARVDPSHPLGANSVSPFSIEKVQDQISNLYYFFPERTLSTHVVASDENGNALLTVQQSGPYRSIFWSLPHIPKRLLRAMAEYADVHLYSDALDVVYANESYLVIHTSSPGSRTIKFTSPCNIYDEYLNQYRGKGIVSFGLTNTGISSYIFRIDKK